MDDTATPDGLRSRDFNLRDARPTDIPELMSIRSSVRENALTSTTLDAADYERALTAEGRGWVCEVDGRVVGFVDARPGHGDIWALFVREAYEGRGIATALMDEAEAWMFAQGLEEIRLTTMPGTRAERLYERRGWTRCGVTESGDVELVLRRRERAERG